MRQIDSAHSVWLFDEERMVYRRLPRGSDVSVPSLAADWETYYALELDDESGTFTVALNDARTRLIRATRVEVASDVDTTELSLTPVDVPPTEGD